MPASSNRPQLAETSPKSLQDAKLSSVPVQFWEVIETGLLPSANSVSVSAMAPSQMRSVASRLQGMPTQCYYHKARSQAVCMRLTLPLPSTHHHRQFHICHLSTPQLDPHSTCHLSDAVWRLTLHSYDRFQGKP